MIEGITRLLEDTELHQRIAKAVRAYAETHFASQHVIDAYEAKLHQISPLASDNHTAQA